MPVLTSVTRILLQEVRCGLWRRIKKKKIKAWWNFSCSLLGASLSTPNSECKRFCRGNVLIFLLCFFSVILYLYSRILGEFCRGTTFILKLPAACFSMSPLSIRASRHGSFLPRDFQGLSSRLCLSLGMRDPEEEWWAREDIFRNAVMLGGQHPSWRVLVYFKELFKWKLYCSLCYFRLLSFSSIYRIYDWLLIHFALWKCISYF